MMRLRLRVSLGSLRKLEGVDLPKTVFVGVIEFLIDYLGGGILE